jgi:hypothetical protein
MENPFSVFVGKALNHRNNTPVLRIYVKREYSIINSQSMRPPVGWNIFSDYLIDFQCSQLKTEHPRNQQFDL